MGLPLTWVTLSLLHLFWMDEAISNTVRDKYKRFSICGDDMLAVLTKDEVTSYEYLVKACGGDFSEGKHLKSDSYGVFLEKQIKLFKV